MFKLIVFRGHPRSEDVAAFERSAHPPAWAVMRADAGAMIERSGVSLRVGMGHEERAELGSA